MDQEMKKNLEKDIVVTIVYSDVFDMPLTAFEIWKYRIFSGRLTGEKTGINKPVSLFSIEEVLEGLCQKGIVVRRYGMYALKGKEYLVEDRIYRIKRSDDKWKKFFRLAYFFRIVPFVRMIAVTGRLSTKYVGRESDWDILAVMEKGRIWTGRFVLTLFLHILRKRRWGVRTKDRVCLNHFLTTHSLSVPLKDLFGAREYSFIFPVLGFSTFKDFERENSWIRDYLPQWAPSRIMPLRVRENPLTMSGRIFVFLQNLGEFLLSDRFENFLRRIQKRKIANNPKTGIPGAFIRATDDALVFLPDPQGPRVFEAFANRLKELGHGNRSL